MASNISVFDFNQHGGSHKAVGIDEIIADVRRLQVDTVVVISSGNYVQMIIDGVRTNHLEERVRIVNLVNRPLGFPCVEIAMSGKIILETAQQREAYVETALGETGGKVKDYTDFRPRAYAEHARSILATKPDYVVVPVGSGKLQEAVYEEIECQRLCTKIIRVVPKGENAIFTIDRQTGVDNLYRQKDGTKCYRVFDPKTPADKLACPDTALALKMRQEIEEGHPVYEATPEQLLRANREALRLDYEAEVSGSAGFVILDAKVREELGVGCDDRIVVVNTGRGHSLPQNDLLVQRNPLGSETI
jgi:threonine synthase